MISLAAFEELDSVTVSTVGRSHIGVREPAHTSHSALTHNHLIVTTTDVLEGIGVIEKTEKNFIQWAHSPSGEVNMEEKTKLQEEVCSTLCPDHIVLGAWMALATPWHSVPPSR